MAQKTEVACADLRAFLGDIEVFDRAEMVRKGRHVKHGLVEVEKADGGFLDDRFRAVDHVDRPGHTRRGRCWGAKVTLLCAGKLNCQRQCGGFGRCIEGELSTFI